MNTEYLTVDPLHPEPDTIRRAAAVVRAGGLVAFPTETVYGLGANALDPTAVGRIFVAKGRPATNPVIVHVADPAQVLNVAADWPETAARLAARFWPGPLTLVVPKRAEVPDAVTAGGPTVAVRCPAHAVARALIREAGVPVAAPSANRSTELSPTRAEHVLKGLKGRIEMVLDGGPCPGGLESTVADMTSVVVRVLRPGLVTVPMLEEIVGRVEVAKRDSSEEVARSPGQMEKHYSPHTPVKLVGDDAYVKSLDEASLCHQKIGSVIFEGKTASRMEGYPVGGVRRVFNLTSNPETAGSLLYDTLHQLDLSGISLIIIELPPDTPEWAAVRDRLQRAAASR